MNGALAQHHAGPTHSGLPVPIIKAQRVGPYDASVWTHPGIGIGTVYVVLDAADAVTFVQPSAVRVAVVPVSGRLAEVVHEAHPERVRRGARFITEVVFDRPERWNVRVVIEGPAGGGQLTSQVEVTADATLGPVGLVLDSLPFLLVALVWWRARVVRQRTIGRPQRGGGQPHALARS